MNIVHPGDTVIIAIPATYSSRQQRESVENAINNFPQAIKESANAAGSFSFTWLPIGSQDSEPSVLFVIRQQ